MAMAEFGETYPGGDNFWFGEIHSVKGLLEKYSNAVNPFGDESLTLKDPIKYSDKVDISFAESTKKISIQELI